MNNIKTPAELEAIKLAKMATHYKVKENFKTATKDVDMTKRIVQSIPNTYYYFDSDSDVLIPGCAAKTFKERGPDSNGDAKIKNVKDHNISQRIGKPTLLEEKILDNRNVMYAESKMASTTIGNDMLIEYQEGLIDQHSIGFRYMDLNFLDREATDWKKWVDLLINPEDAEAAGYMFIIKEIEMFEWSPVSFGANQLSAYLGVKSMNKDSLLLKIFDRVDLLEKQLRSGKQSDFAMFDYELETRQLKQIIHELFNLEPSKKDTLLAERRRLEDTRNKNSATVICQSCMKSFTYSTETDVGSNGTVKCGNCGQFVSQDGSMIAPIDLDKAIKETSFFNHSKFFNT